MQSIGDEQRQGPGILSVEIDVQEGFEGIKEQWKGLWGKVLALQSICQALYDSYRLGQSSSKGNAAHILILWKRLAL